MTRAQKMEKLLKSIKRRIDRGNRQAKELGCFVDPEEVQLSKQIAKVLGGK